MKMYNIGSGRQRVMRRRLLRRIRCRIVRILHLIRVDEDAEVSGGLSSLTSLHSFVEK
jgi:hypothetical protein